MSHYLARTDGLVVEELDGGLVIYDEHTDEAHWLPACTADVWRACARSADCATIATLAGVELDRCQDALDEFARVGLLASEPEGLSRRTALRSAAKLRVAGAMTGAIVSAMIPSAAAADSLPQILKA